MEVKMWTVLLPASLRRNNHNYDDYGRVWSSISLRTNTIIHHRWLFTPFCGGTDVL